MSHVIAVRLTDSEWTAFQQVQFRNHVTAQQLLHGIIIDALVDEGYDALQRRKQEGCQIAGETGEARGTAKEGSDRRDNVSGPREEMDGGASGTLPLFPDELQRTSDEDGLHGGPAGSRDNAV